MIIRIALMVFLIVISLSGCVDDNSKTVQNVSTTGENIAEKTAIQKSPQEVFLLDQLKLTDIEWITKKGGLFSRKNWAVLYPEKDEEKIAKIINLIKSCSDIHKSTQDDLGFLGSRHHYPVDIVIKMKAGSQFSLMSAMKLTTRKGDNGTETTGTTYKDHFLLAYTKNNSTECYTIYSNDATTYILDPTNPDFPKVDNFAITPKEFNYGDKISISGGGCTEKEVNIILENDKEEYVIGKVKPVYGEWHWDGIINKNIKSYDGKDINFTNKKFFIGIQVNGSRYTRGSI